MQLQDEINDPMSSPSFSYYYSDSSTAIAAAKVSREAAQFRELSYVDEAADFQFSIDHLSDEEVSGKQIDIELEGLRFAFPIFANKQLTKESVDQAIEDIDYASSFRIQVQKLFVDDVEDQSYSSSSPSSSVTETYKSEPRSSSGMFCMWRSKSKKRNSTGSGLSRWRIWNLLRRGNGEGKESSVLLLRSKKVNASKQKREEVTRVAGKLKITSFHEQFYVQKRSEQKGDKKKTFLPYRQDLLGLFVNINRIGNKHADYHFII
ncbi:hypothetical protein LXL04_006147 [Taraxacum kok-saghyz]